MTLRRSLPVALSVVALFVCAFAASAALPDYGALGKQLVLSLAAGRFAEVEANFDARMSTALPEQKLAEVWNGLVGKVGKFESIEGAQSSSQNGFQIAVVTCRFEMTELNTRIAFGADGKVAGLFFLPAASNRPQNPSGPLPYRHLDVTFENAQAGIKLAGTLTIPEGKGPFPAAVLVAGSGPHDRDETVFGHKPFLVLSDYLTRHGIATLRYDKRGIGQSGGNEATATTADFADDAEAGFNFLRAQPGVNPRKVGLIGHSEGGDIAPMVAARNPNVAFIVMMAGPGVPGDQVIPAQVGANAEAMGASSVVAEKAEEEEKEILSLVESTAPGPAHYDELRAKLKGKIPPAALGGAVKELDSPWYRFMLTYDPATALEKVKCPVLALNGSKDTQVVAQENLSAIRKALIAGGNKNFEIDELPGLNHLFQPAKTGALAEYGQIETTIAPAALEKISNWIRKP